MILEGKVSPAKLFMEKTKRLFFFGGVLVLLALPASSWAAYLPGPPDILSALQFNSQGDLVPALPIDSRGGIASGDLSRDHHLVQTDPSTGALLPAQPNPAAQENLPDASEPGGSETDPFLDDDIEEGPFGEEAFGDAAFEEDPFAEEGDGAPPISDPFERWYNRPVYVFNDHFYEYFMRPVAQTYRDILPEDLRIIIRNIFRNLLFPQRLIGSLFQGDFEKTGRVLSRTLINTTLGIGGMFEVADLEFGIKPVDEDFGQALGVWGIPSGPYIVLPILGPSSARDAFGRVVDTLLNPLFGLVPDFVTSASITAGQMVNETTFYIDDIKALKDSAIDPYISFRDFYHQSRENSIDD